MAYRTDGTANFNFFINRQGPRGPQGIQGPEGFSPNVQVEEDHGNTFTLRVTNKDNFFITSNLREHKEDRGGDYIRYDRAGQLMYIGDPNFATTVKAGEVRLSTVDDLTAGSDTVALTPKVYKDDITNIKSEIQGDIAATNLKIDNLDKASVKLSGNQVINGQKRFNDTTSVKALKTDSIIGSNGNNIIRQEQQNINIGGIDTVSTIITSSNLSFNDTFRNLGHILCQETVTAGDNTVIEKTTNGIKISSTAQGDVTLAGDNSFTGNNTFDGVSTFNGDTWVNSLKVGTSLKNQQDKLFLNQSSITAGDNITVEETTDGVKISSTGGGSSEPPANMVTTDTKQTITGSKTLDSSLYVNNPDLMSRTLSISTEKLCCSTIELGKVWTSDNGDYIYPDGYRTITAIAKNGVPIPMITCNTAGANPNVISFGVSDAYDVIIPAKAKTYGGKKFLVQGSITAGSDNLLITETTDGVQITCNAPTNAQIEALQRLINDLSTKIDNLTNRVVALETQIDGGVAGSIYAPEPQKLQEQVVEGLSINETLNSVTEDVQVNDNGGT